MNTNTANHTRDMIYISIFAVLIAICSWISIPATVPFTLQTFAIFLAVFILGGKRGCSAIIIYILLGFIGIPVFSGFTGGIGVLFANTGGYIIGFVFTGLFLWMTEKIYQKSIFLKIICSIISLLICYAFGTAWFIYLYSQKTSGIQIITVLGWCVFPFIIPDLIKLGIAILLGKRLSKIVHN